MKMCAMQYLLYWKLAVKHRGIFNIIFWAFCPWGKTNKWFKEIGKENQIKCEFLPVTTFPCACANRRAEHEERKKKQKSNRINMKHKNINLRLFIYDIYSFKLIFTNESLLMKCVFSPCHSINEHKSLHNISVLDMRQLYQAYDHGLVLIKLHNYLGSSIYILCE